MAHHGSGPCRGKTRDRRVCGGPGSTISPKWGISGRFFGRHYRNLSHADRNWERNQAQVTVERRTDEQI
jgi:hypothetical protein